MSFQTTLLFLGVRVSLAGRATDEGKILNQLRHKNVLVNTCDLIVDLRSSGRPAVSRSVVCWRGALLLKNLPLPGRRSELLLREGGRSASRTSAF